MGDLALIFCFLCMLMVPCYLATRTVRGRKAARAASWSVLAVEESDEDGETSVATREAIIDRQALAIQRNREIYFRTGGRSPESDYESLGDGAGVLD